MRKNSLKIALFSLVLLGVSAISYTALRKKERILLVTGCARSGTSFTSRILRNAGLDIPHEEMGKDGAVSWYLATQPDYRKRRINLKKYYFAHTFHQTRDPLKTISSVYFAENLHSWNYILKHTPEISFRDSHLVKCAKYWYYWNLKAEKCSEWSFRVEDIEQVLQEMPSRLGIDLLPVDLQNQPKNMNSMGEHPDFSWTDLEKELPLDLYENIIQMAKRYGYTVPSRTQA